MLIDIGNRLDYTLFSSQTNKKRNSPVTAAVSVKMGENKHIKTHMCQDHIIRTIHILPVLCMSGLLLIKKQALTLAAIQQEQQKLPLLLCFLFQFITF